MANGEGKYNDWCTRIREGEHALGVIVIVAAGDGGSGYSVQGPQSFQDSLPYTLEALAKLIREERANAKRN